MNLAERFTFFERQQLLCLHKLDALFMGQLELSLQRIGLFFQALASLFKPALFNASLDGSTQHDEQVEDEMKGN